MVAHPLLTLSWTQRTPWHEAIKQQFGISDVARALCVRDDIVLVATPLHRSFFATFAKEHFDADITFAASRQISDTFVVGSFHQQVTHGKTGNRQIDAVKR